MSEKSDSGEVAALIERLRAVADEHEGYFAKESPAARCVIWNLREAADALARLSAPVPDKEK